MSSQKGWEIGFPLAGWGNDDKVPLLVSSINFVISHSSFFIPRWKSPLWTQFRFLTWLVHPVLAPGHSLDLDQHLLRPFSFLLRLSPSADQCKGSPGERGFDESTCVAALKTLGEYAPWSRPSNVIMCIIYTSTPAFRPCCWKTPVTEQQEKSAPM